MEMVPIIYSCLIIAGLLLTIVILASYLLSKRHRNQETENKIHRLQSDQPLYFNHEMQHNKPVNQPVIYPINDNQQKEIKIVHRQSYEEYKNSNRIEESKNTKKPAKRYTILNEEIKSSRYGFASEK